MGRRDGVKGIRHKEVCGRRIGLMYVHYSMYFYYLLLFVIHVLSLDKFGDLLMYLSLSVIRYTSAELSYACQTAGVWIGKQLSNEATADDTALHTGFTEKGSSHVI